MGGKRPETRVNKAQRKTKQTPTALFAYPPSPSPTSRLLLLKNSDMRATASQPPEIPRQSASSQELWKAEAAGGINREDQGGE